MSDNKSKPKDWFEKEYTECEKDILSIKFRPIEPGKKMEFSKFSKLKKGKIEMTKEKQIEEMARVWCGMNYKPSCRVCGEENCYEIGKSKMIYDAGYRKASEVAREIFEEIHESIKAEKFHHKNFGDLVYLADIDRILAELQKKYTEGGE